jgi:hypothetical protein
MCDQHEFVFEFDKAYNAQLIEKFEASPEHPLTLDVAPPLRGVYALYRSGQLVYAGKALPTTLRRRLNEHFAKIDSRLNISIEEMSCRFLTIQGSWFVRAAEDALSLTIVRPGTRVASGVTFLASADPGFGSAGGTRIFPFGLLPQNDCCIIKLR